MSAKNTLKKFFKRFDRYSKPVTLTYRQKGSFDTSCGGLMSIISFIILAWWLATELISKFVIQATYATSEKISLTQKDDTTFPVFELSSREFFVTYRMMSTTGFDNTELMKYYTPIWF